MDGKDSKIEKQDSLSKKAEVSRASTKLMKDLPVTELMSHLAWWR